ncbi:MAG TPA: UDP-N-acetylmuramate--L-alanine ligase [Elusimicrobia bacterium]|nr:MAG: UDP-N-acetylmuramate--L-alanine ligase [Elusimicrobia bacterium GWA2_51_34]HAF96414.1 UDP-N-acetylmuramate--L-alanine ligase [Elusimicrobiota bacterium]HCE97121.1 UDP-N-acetylmuramate--L-alanine ligase [Elusimicrobiota bacterium]
MNLTLDFSLEEIKKVHFIGIGGIGMSGIARLMLAAGFKVTGSDLNDSEITRGLKSEGACVFLGHKAANLGDCDIVVVSSAIRPDNPELKRACAVGVKVVPRARMLSKIAELKKTVAVSGTHGKTTTTSMTAAALHAAGADATAVVGGIFKNAGSNIRLGKSEYFVIEADESDGSFLHFSPLVACITNIDSDHLDHYGSMENLKNAFLSFARKPPFYGTAVLCADDANVLELAGALAGPFLTYGLKNRSDWTAKDARPLPGGGTAYTAVFRGVEKGRVRLGAWGRHNLLNSLCALAAGSYLGFDFKKLSEGIAGFKGVKRRLERLGAASGVEFFDDYGHHPTEIKAALDAAAEVFRGRRLVVLFQPHRYSRTRLLFRQFPQAFASAGKVYVKDIYPAGEKPIAGVTSRLVLDGIKKAGIAVSEFPGALELSKELRTGDVLITVGAGDVWKTGAEVKMLLQ